MNHQIGGISLLGVIYNLWIIWLTIKGFDAAMGSDQLISLDQQPQMLQPSFSNATNWNATSLNELVIGNGTILNLACFGTQQIQWSLPGRNMSMIEPRMSVSESTDSVTGMIVSNLTLDSLTYDETGYVHCHYGDLDSDSAASDDHTGVYVYVFDGEHFFALVYEMPNHPVIVSQTSEAIIPCRPTRPDINVTLSKQGQQVNRSELNYDKHRGVVLNYPSIYYSDSFQCSGQFENQTETIDLELYWLPRTSSVAKPEINDTLAKHVMVGGSFTLTCSVADFYNIPHRLMWTHHQLVDGARVVESAQTSRHKQDTDSKASYREFSRSITVSGVRATDQGNFTCSVSDINKNTDSDSKFVKVYTEPTHVAIVHDIRGIWTVKGPVVNDDLKLRITVDAYPRRNLTWLLLRDGQSVDMVNGKHRFITVPNSETQVVLRIRRPVTKFDSGNYTVVAKVGSQADNFTIPVQITESPSVRVIENRRYFEPGSTGVIVCEAVGNPVPGIHFEWKSCQSTLCKNSNSSFARVADLISDGFSASEERLSVANFTATYSLRFQAVRHGIVRCVANDTVTARSNDTPVVVSAVSEGFQLSTNLESELQDNQSVTPIENTYFNITCGISSFVYQRGIRWFRRNGERGDVAEITFNHSAAIRIETKSTEYDFYSSLIFGGVPVNATGLYTCECKGINNRTWGKDLQVDVRAIEKPVIKVSNMNGSSLVLNESEPFKFTCDVTGVPEPEVTWWKDNQPITRENKPTYVDIGKGSLTIKRLGVNDNGRYVCKASNAGGFVYRVMDLSINGAARASLYDSKTKVILAFLLLVVLIAFALLIIALCRKMADNRENKRQLEILRSMLFDQEEKGEINPDMPINEQAELLKYDGNRWEFPRANLRLGKLLGKGAFGKVVQADAYGLVEGHNVTICAVKMMREETDESQKIALAKELKIMSHLGNHINIVNLLGACTANILEGELLVLIEYCPYGSLRNVLLTNKYQFIDQICSTTGRIDVSIGFPRRGRPRRVSSSNSTISYQNEVNSADRTTVPLLNCVPFSFINDLYVPSSFPRTTSVSTVTGSPSYSCQTVTTPLTDREMTFTTQANGYVNSVYHEVPSKYRPLTTCDLLSYSFQIARGMEYLASRNLVHRDLAARNVLLAADNIVKICDFGLAHDANYYFAKNKNNKTLLPIKWLALESLVENVFSTRSDVWSYGVLMWELFALGSNPYPGMGCDSKFIHRLMTGYRLEKPHFANDKIYNIMQKCWLAEPDSRPTFGDLVEKVGDLLESGMRQHYLDLYTRSNSESDYTAMSGQTVQYSNITPTQSGEDYLDMQSPGGELEPITPFIHYDNVRRPSPARMEQRVRTLEPCTVQSDIFELKPVPIKNKKKANQFKTFGRAQSEEKQHQNGYLEPIAVMSDCRNPIAISSNPGRNCAVSNPAYADFPVGDLAKPQTPLVSCNPGYSVLELEPFTDWNLQPDVYSTIRYRDSNSDPLMTSTPSEGDGAHFAQNGVVYPRQNSVSDSVLKKSPNVSVGSTASSGFYSDYVESPKLALRT